MKRRVLHIFQIFLMLMVLLLGNGMEGVRPIEEILEDYDQLERVGNYKGKNGETANMPLKDYQKSQINRVRKKVHKIFKTKKGS